MKMHYCTEYAYKGIIKRRNNYMTVGRDTCGRLLVSGKPPCIVVVQVDAHCCGTEYCNMEALPSRAETEGQVIGIQGIAEDTQGALEPIL